MTKALATDEELFIAIKHDERKAFDILYRRYWALVYKQAFSYLHDPDACAEIVNDIFLNIWLKRKDLNIIKFEGYLTAAARYRVYNILKAKKSNKITYIEDYEHLASLNTDNNVGEVNINTHEIHHQLSHLLNQLPERCKEIFLLSRMSHLTNTEIASKLSVSKRTVENQISLAVKYLRRHFCILAILFSVLSLL
jgi:RNA polymerase sigma-70 factor (family 1)